MKRYIIEFGTGIDFHGQDSTGAARKAVRDAVSHSCLCGLSELFGITDLNENHTSFRPRNDIEVRGRKISGIGGTEKEGRMVRYQGCFLDLGFLNYQDAYRIQQTLNQRRIAGRIGDVLILVEHSPTLTVGRDGGLQNIRVPREQLARQGITVYEVERGGNITYHGPGQLVGYPILDLKQWGKDLHRYVRQLEEVIIKSLAVHGVRAGRRENYPGVWVGPEKIAALGVAVKKWVSMHGFAFNISCNLEHFQWIVPCGISGYGVTSLARCLGQKPDFREVSRLVRDTFAEVFEIELKKVSLEELLGTEEITTGEGFVANALSAW